MKHYRISTFFLYLSLFLVTSCQAQEETIPDRSEENVAQQYGTPFGEVPAISDIIMYEVNPLVFSPQRNLKGVQERLGELQDLGVNVLWLMPIHPIGEERGIGSPYAVQDYYQVNPRYGTLEDLRALVEEAHNRGMAVILDLVANHTAWDHPWITTNRSWYTQDAQGNIQYPNTWQDVAELNFDRQELRLELIEMMKYWVLEANVDGYRCDHADGVPISFWKEAIGELRDLPNRDIIMFAEGGNKELFEADFDLIFGWNFYHNLKEVFQNGKPAHELLQVNEQDYHGVPDGAHILRFITNHDDNTYDDVPQRIFQNQDGAMAAFIITSYLDGVPMLYNGQEVGTPENIPFFYPTNFTLDWSINPEIRQAYQQVIALRQENAAIRQGTLNYRGNHPDILSFTKNYMGEEVLVMVNVRDNSIAYQVPEAFQQDIWTDAFSGEAAELPGAVSFQPFQYRVFLK